MTRLLATLGFSVWLTLSVSAQECSVGPGPDGNPLSLQEWYTMCRAQMIQLCDYMASITPAAKCTDIVNNYYVQYVRSIITFNHTTCSQANVGETRCDSGWLATCDGTVWRTGSDHCSGQQ